MSSIVQRSFRSFSWTASAQVVVVGVGFARSVLLARLLDVETFGIYAGAMAIVNLLAIPAMMGLSGAFLHRAPETEDEDRAAAVFLTMQVGVGAIWLVLVVLGALAFASGPTRTSVIVLAIATAIEFLTFPPTVIMNRRVVLQRIAKTQMVMTVVAAVVALSLAWIGAELWALLITELVSVIVVVLAYYAWKPVWRPHFQLDRTIFNYYLRFGIPNTFSHLAGQALQQLDDLYVRFFLGVREMGFYSRAYVFASYPRSILATPVTLVSTSAFAELSSDRLRLSQAFFRTNALLIRVSFLFGGMFILCAPEIVLILLGEKWLPMVPIFRLFALFTLLDPLRDVLASIYLALGLPQRLLASRLVQLVVMVVGLWLLGGRWGAEGVAVAVNLMVVTGLVLMLRAVRPYLDFSVMRLFGPPLVALLLALLPVAAFLWYGLFPENTLLLAIAKAFLFGVVYLGALTGFERAQLKEIAGMARSYMVGRRGNSVPAPESITSDWDLVAGRVTAEDLISSQVFDLLQAEAIESGNTSSSDDGPEIAKRAGTEKEESPGDRA